MKIIFIHGSGKKPRGEQDDRAKINVLFRRLFALTSPPDKYKILAAARRREEGTKLRYSMDESLIVRQARENNLKNLDLDIPLGKLTVVSGPSGAGKTSLVVDTLFAESQRRFIETVGVRRRNRFGLWKRPKVDRIENLPPAINASGQADSSETLAQMSELDSTAQRLFQLAGRYFCPECQEDAWNGSPSVLTRLLGERFPGRRAMVAFPLYDPENCDKNSAAEAEDWSIRAAECVQNGLSRALIPADGASKETSYSLRDLSVSDKNARASEANWSNALILVDRLTFPKDLASDNAADDNFCRKSPDFTRLTDSLEIAFAQGNRQAVLFIEPDSEQTAEPGSIEVDGRRFLRRFVSVRPCCSVCGQPIPDDSVRIPVSVPKGAPFLTYTKFYESSADQLTATIAALRSRFDGKTDEQARRLKPVLDKLAERLESLQNCALGYMALNREAGTLSANQVKRARIAAMAAADLVNMLYTLDEPADQMFSQEVPALLRAVQKIRDRGNTVVVVEQSPEFLAAAENRIVLKDGAIDPAEKQSDSARDSILPSQSMAAAQISVDLFPVGKLSIVCGKSGSGKSRLFAKLRQECVNLGRETTAIESVPPSRTGSVGVRGSVATNLKIWEKIRDELAQTPDAQARGLTSGAFSFSSTVGRCPQCKGEGVLKIDIPYMPDREMVCDECSGQRFKPEILQVRYRNLNAAEILEMSAQDAFLFFRGARKVQMSLKSLIDIGLGYLPLGQRLTTLSTGELQRLRLAGPLAGLKRTTTVFLLEEPSSGLGETDLLPLADVLKNLASFGHRVIAFDNNPFFFPAADQVIELE